MDQLFIIDRFKPEENKQSWDTKEKFAAALDELLKQARERQQRRSSDADKTDQLSPKTTTKRKLFLSPDHPKRLKKLRPDQELSSSTPDQNLQAKFKDIPLSVVSNSFNSEECQTNLVQSPKLKSNNKTTRVISEENVNEDHKDRRTEEENLSENLEISLNGVLHQKLEPERVFRKKFRTKKEKCSTISRNDDLDKGVDAQPSVNFPTKYDTTCDQLVSSTRDIPMTNSNQNAATSQSSFKKKFRTRKPKALAEKHLQNPREKNDANGEISEQETGIGSQDCPDSVPSSVDDLPNTSQSKMESGNTWSKDNSDDELEAPFNNNPVQSGNNQPEGFTVLGEVAVKSKDAVTRNLPKWLSHPTMISSNLQDKKTTIAQISELDDTLQAKLLENGITHFFPVQQEVIPWLLRSFSTAIVFRPRDICVSAPTGSGKTLAYILPIVHALKDRLVPLVRALIILPVKDLASQVFKVLQKYIKGTPLRAALIVGQKPHDVEERSLLKPNERGGVLSLVDLIVATPGSLIHHIQRTEGFSLHHLRFLVVDEADRMIEDIQEGWLSTVEKAIQSKKTQSCQCRGKSSSSRLLSGPIIACCLKRPVEPCQKLLFSATLSHDPEKLKMLSLFNPKLFTSHVTSKHKVDSKQEMVEEFSVPQELTELTVVCETQMKPLLLWYLLRKKRYSRVLCFTNTVESSHRLTLLLNELGDVSVQELSSHLKTKQRRSILNQFASGKLEALICSDMMARGMDLENVQCVVCYDLPPYIKTYIHRIGRTARAGQSGTALSLLHKNELHQFKRLMKSANRPEVMKMSLEFSELEIFQEHYQNALEAVGTMVAEQELKVKQKRNIFQKTKRKNK